MTVALYQNLFKILSPWADHSIFNKCSKPNTNTFSCALKLINFRAQLIVFVLAFIHLLKILVMTQQCLPFQIVVE